MLCRAETQDFSGMSFFLFPAIHFFSVTDYKSTLDFFTAQWLSKESALITCFASYLSRGFHGMDAA